MKTLPWSIKDSCLYSIFILKKMIAMARISFRIIGWPNKSRLFLQIIENLFFIPDVIT